MKKKMLSSTAVVIVLLTVIGLSSRGVQEASATFTHRWNWSASDGLGLYPNNRECGLWDNAPGYSYKKCALLWILCNGPHENEWARYRTTEIDVDPAGGWNKLFVRCFVGSGIYIEVGVRYSITGWTPTPYPFRSYSTGSWRSTTVSLSTGNGRITGVQIAINDYPNSIDDRCMALIDCIQIRNAAGTPVWSEEF